MFHIIRASFNQRRKTLANGLSNAPQVHLSKEEIQECIAELGEPLTIRGGGAHVRAVCSSFQYYWKQTEKIKQN